MLSIIQHILESYMEKEIADIQDGFRKGHRASDLMADECWVIEKVKELQKNALH